MPDNFIFLGAGASRPFELPTMQGMVEGFETFLDSKPPEQKTLYSDIKDNQKKHYKSRNVDIESIYSVVQGLANGIPLEEMGHLAFYHMAKKFDVEKFQIINKDEAKELQKTIEEFIKSECKSPLSELEIIKMYETTYEPFFSFLDNQKIKYPSGRSYAKFWRSYGTNYDNVFEDFWHDDITLTDFFIRDGQSQNLIFDSNQNPENHCYIKLHGSIDWKKRQSDNKVMKKAPGVSRHLITGDVMIFPIQQKDMYLYPWDVQFRHLKNSLNLIPNWYVIGYSFNDEFILEIFKEAFTNAKILTIIGPSADKIREKFPKEYHDRIFALPIKFGDKYFPQQFKDYTTKSKTIKFKIKTPSGSSIGLFSSLPILEAKITETEKTKVGEKSINAAREIVTLPISHDSDDEIELLLTIEHEGPFDRDLEIKLLLNAPQHYEISAYLYDKSIIALNGKTLTQDPNLDIYYPSKTITIKANELFVNS